MAAEEMIGESLKESPAPGYPGDPAQAPPARTWPSGWRIGTPDVVIPMPEPYDVPAAGVVEPEHQRLDQPLGIDGPGHGPKQRVHPHAVQR